MHVSEIYARSYPRKKRKGKRLSFEEEIALSKTIDDGKAKIFDGIFRSPLTFKELKIWCDQLKNNELPLENLVDLDAIIYKEYGSLEKQEKAQMSTDESDFCGDDFEDVSENLTPSIIKMEKDLRAEIAQKLDQIANQSEKLQAVNARIVDDYVSGREINPDDRVKAENIIETTLSMLKLVHINPQRINKLVEQLHNRNNALLKSERDIILCAEGHGIERKNFDKHFSGNEFDPRWKNHVRKTSSIWEKFVDLYEDELNLFQVELKIFCKDINLPLQDFKDLYMIVKTSEKEVETATKKLFQGNFFIVISLAKQFINQGVEFDDLVQEGNVGLKKAIDKFDYQRGYSFTMYAHTSIRRAIARSVSEFGRTIRLPVHLCDTIDRIKQTQKEFLFYEGRQPTPAELSEVLHIPEEKIIKFLKNAQSTVSLNQPTDENPKSILEDVLEDDAIDLDARMFRNSLRISVNRTLSALTPREERILRMRFGIGPIMSEHTLEEVGKEFAVTRERIRQIEAKALDKLRHPVRIRALKTFREQV